MAGKSGALVIHVVLGNQKAVRALGVAVRAVCDMQEDMPWRPELKRAAKALRYAAKNLTVKVARAE